MNDQTVTRLHKVATEAMRLLAELDALIRRAEQLRQTITGIWEAADQALDGEAQTIANSAEINT